jgi:integrase/recombinase XerD
VSRLHESLEEYLELRRGLGFKLEDAEHLLRDFATYVEETGSTTVTSALAVAWAQQPSDGHPSWWGARLSHVRGFARYLHAIDPIHEVPAAELLPARSRRATPYLYSDTDIVHLLAAARRLRPPLRGATYATYIGLLAVTGMRAGEAISLDREDVDWTDGVLTVRCGKFGKSRELVLHPSVVDRLAAYDRERRQLQPKPKTAALFVSTRGTRLVYQNVHFTFHQLVQQAGLTPRSTACRPRIHDLRHTFAVTTLLSWYRSDEGVAGRMHRLSTYLGHLNPVDTYWYLSATPELLALAGQRLERHLGDLR